eukprot:6673676-Prymnesium_polylepis.1
MVQGYDILGPDPLGTRGFQVRCKIGAASAKSSLEVWATMVTSKTRSGSKLRPPAGRPHPRARHAPGGAPPMDGRNG